MSDEDKRDRFLMDYFIGELREFEKQTKKDKHWAHSVCKASRAAHLRVLLEGPPADTIDAVIECLNRLRGKVMLVAATEPEAEKYADNVAARIDGLKRFKNGDSPAEPPGATDEEKEVIKMVGECWAYARGRK